MSTPDRSKAQGAQVLTIPFLMMHVFEKTTFDPDVINRTDTRNPSLNAFPRFVRKEAGLVRSKVLRKGST
jgi:hypothetical protein